jgi:hypothetical protein
MVDAPGANAQLTQPQCQTSGASGLTVDCAQTITILQNMGAASCTQSNAFLFGSHCTTLVTAGSCSVGICGALASQPCSVVADYVTTLTNTCAASINGQSRSGGQQVMNENNQLRIILT